MNDIDQDPDVASARACEPPPDRRRTHPGPLFYEILATFPPQPSRRPTLPRAARRHRRARVSHVFIIVPRPWLNPPLRVPSWPFVEDTKQTHLAVNPRTT